MPTNRIFTAACIAVTLVAGLGVLARAGSSTDTAPTSTSITRPTPTTNDLAAGVAEFDRVAAAAKAPPTTTTTSPVQRLEELEMDLICIQFELGGNRCPRDQQRLDESICVEYDEKVGFGYTPSLPALGTADFWADCR